VAAERRSLAAAIFPERRFSPEVVEPPARRAAPWSDREGALTEVVRAHLALVGPTTATRLGARLDVAPADIEAALVRVELEGGALRGRFDPTLGDETHWCDRRLLARINRRMLDGLRREIEPVSAADLMRFLLAWQHVRPGSQLHGRAGVAQVVAQLQGFESAAGAWEREILPARVAGYDPAWLDALCLSGEVAWGRLAPRDGGGAPTRAAPIALALRRDLGWLLAEPSPDGDGAGAATPVLSPAGREVLAFLETAGASFLDEIVAGAGRLRTEVEDGLWELVSAGRVTGDGFAGLRALISATQSRGGARARWHARWNRRNGGPVDAGRWALLRAPRIERDEETRTEALARQYIRRYGVVFRDVLAREAHAPPWRDLVRVYRRLEMRGELRGGRLVAGFVGEQFAAPEAVEALRAIRRDPKRDQHVRLSACDPLNLIGILTPGPRVPATLANSVALRDGVPDLGPAPAAVSGLSAAPLPSTPDRYLIANETRDGV
jgi:ATP-dependent Lhr-like helicase